MNADDYQIQAARTANDSDLQSVLVNAALGLTGESGEFADLIKKWVFHGHVLSKEELSKELGDILWYIARSCTALDINLGDVMQANIDKLWERYPEGFNSDASKARVDTKLPGDRGDGRERDAFGVPYHEEDGMGKSKKTTIPYGELHSL